MGNRGNHKFALLIYIYSFITSSPSYIYFFNAMNVKTR